MRLSGGSPISQVSSSRDQQRHPAGGASGDLYRFPRSQSKPAVEEIIVFWTTDVGSAQLSQLTQRLKRLGLVI
jgi:hypothetical protein